MKNRILMAMRKPALTVLFAGLTLTGVFAMAGITSAATDGKLGVDPATCTFTSSSGLLDIGGKSVFSADTTRCNPGLLADYMIALINFFFRLAIVLAVLMITIGGFQWLMAIGNSSKISNAKDTIQQAVVGLILAMTATLLFGQIDKSFTTFDKSQLDIRPGAGDYSFCKTIEPATFYFQAMSVTGEEQGDPKVMAEAMKIAEVECGKQSGRCEWTGGKCVPFGGAAGEGGYVKITGKFWFKDGTMAAPVMALQLQCLSDSFTPGKVLTITEAYPPTIPHKDPKHNNGCAVDMVVPNALFSTECTLVEAVIKAAHGCGLQTTQEYKGCPGYVETELRTADHVHVEMANCP